MTNKYIVAIILGVLLTGMVLLYVIIDRHQKPVESAFSAIPSDVSVIIDIKNYSDLRSGLNTKNQVWQSLSQLDFFKEIEEKFMLIDTLVKTNLFLQNILLRKPQIVISLHPLGKDQMVPVYYITLNNSGDFKHFYKMLENIQGVNITDRKYEGEAFYDIIMSGNRGKFSFSYGKGLLIISPSSILVENVIRRLKAPESIIQKKEFADLIKSAGKNYPANIYLNYKSIPRLLRQTIQSKYYQALRFISNFGGWVELDLNINTNTFILNGFSIPVTDSLGFMSVFTGQEPQKLEIFGKIPYNSLMFSVLGISDLKKYESNYVHYLKHSGTLKAFIAQRDSLQQKYSINLVEDIDSIFDYECGNVVIPGASDSAELKNYTLIRVKSADETEIMLRDWIRKYTDTEDLNPKAFILPAKIDTDFEYTIFTIPFGNIPGIVFGNMFDITTNKYCLIYDNYLVFSNTSTALTEFIQFGLVNNTIISDLEFNNLSDNFSSASNFFFYSKPNKSVGYYSEYLQPAIINSLEKNIQAFSGINSFVYQFSVNENTRIYNNLLIQSATGQTVDAPKTTWESGLEGKIISKPVIVKNHATGENEIFVQDDKTIIYLINNSGRILWKKKLGELIMSDIYQIDYYRNRKLQYFFNTRTKLYLIDRLGNTIENYPVLLPEPASNGISVIDYDKKRKYRVYLATENRNIYLLNKEGKIQDGWYFSKTEGKVTKPIQHFRDKTSDYLVFSDENMIYIVNRKGKIRVKPNRNISLSENNTVYFIAGQKNQKSCFVVTDTVGQVTIIDSEGKVSTHNFGEFPASHYFAVLDINADRQPDYIFAGNKELKAFSQNNSEIISIETEYPITEKPQFYEFSSHKYKIGIVAPENEKIYLYSTSGNLHKGFPLKGSTQFSVGLLNNSENRFNLIVGSSKNFLYNYSVQ